MLLYLYFRASNPDKDLFFCFNSNRGNTKYITRITMVCLYIGNVLYLTTDRDNYFILGTAFFIRSRVTLIVYIIIY